MLGSHRDIRRAEFLVYVADENNHRMQKFGPATIAVELASWGRVKELFR
jgi:hypothetical protein